MIEEVLFSEPATHYLLSSDNPNETVLVTVSPSEVNVMLRYSAAGTPPESMLVAMSTAIGTSNFNIMLKQANRAEEFNDSVTPQELAVSFLDRLQTQLNLVQERRVSEGAENSLALNALQQGVIGLLNQAS